jgi:multiple sugar transport system substrate-binding protein
VNRAIPFYRELEKIHAHARELPRLPQWARLAAVIDRLVTAALDSRAAIPALLAQAQAEADALAA